MVISQSVMVPSEFSTARSRLSGENANPARAVCRTGKRRISLPERSWRIDRELSGPAVASNYPSGEYPEPTSRSEPRVTEPLSRFGTAIWCRRFPVATS